MVVSLLNSPFFKWLAIRVINGVTRVCLIERIGKGGCVIHMLDHRHLTDGL
jgi:hypothetical protein